MKTIPVRMVRLAHGEGLPLPAYAQEGSAYLDLVAAVSGPVTLYPGRFRRVPLGFKLLMPPGLEFQVRSHPSLRSPRCCLVVLGGVQGVDARDRTEVCPWMLNAGEDEIELTRGMVVAAGVIAPVYGAEWAEVTSADYEFHRHFPTLRTGHPGIDAVRELQEGVERVVTPRDLATDRWTVPPVAPVPLVLMGTYTPDEPSMAPRTVFASWCVGGEGVTAQGGPRFFLDSDETRVAECTIEEWREWVVRARPRFEPTWRKGDLREA